MFQCRYFEYRLYVYQMIFPVLDDAATMKENEVCRKEHLSHNLVRNKETMENTGCAAEKMCTHGKENARGGMNNQLTRDIE